MKKIHYCFIKHDESYLSRQQKKSKDVVNPLKNKIEVRQQIYDGKEASEGFSGLFKGIQTEEVNAIGN